MAKGSKAKENIKNKILEIFEGSFLYDGGKEIRIPFVENGELVQIKCTLTCAKTNVDGGDGAVSGGTVDFPAPKQSLPADFINEPTAEEKEAVESLCKKLNII